MFNTIKKKILMANSILLLVISVFMTFSIYKLNENNLNIQKSNEINKELFKVQALKDNLDKYNYNVLRYALLMQNDSFEERNKTHQLINQQLEALQNDKQAQWTELFNQFIEYEEQAVVFFIDDNRA